MQNFKPEGQTILTPSNRAALSSPNALHEACITNETLEARALLCDKEHNLRVDLGCMYGIIPHNEGALGIDDGSVRDIALISRVNKPVMFKIIGFQKDENDREYAILSRKAVQRECMDNYISRLCPGDVITAKVTQWKISACSLISARASTVFCRSTAFPFRESRIRPCVSRSVRR